MTDVDVGSGALLGLDWMDREVQSVANPVVSLEGMFERDRKVNNLTQKSAYADGRWSNDLL